jgi:tetratricopeptide (TPR) repeat protein
MLLWLLLCVLAQQHGHDSGVDNIHAGVALDLAGRSSEARKSFAQAIKGAKTPAEKVQAQRMMAVSYAFTADCRGAEKFDRAAYDFFIESGDFYNAGEVADELGRICLDSGDIDTAYEWYRKGHDAGLEPENLPAARKDLWNYRWAHARARIAARRGKLEEAGRYVSAAKAILEKGTNPDQEIYFPYLTGYVGFYAGDYSGALANLRNANQTDPFIQCLIAQCYEKLGDSGNARTWYRKAASTAAHSVPAAAARPLSVLKLQQIN